MLGVDTNVKGMVAYRPIGQMLSCSDCRKRLVQTALELFASRGYYNTSIADILRESRCTRGTLYYYFSSKEELGYAVIDEAIRVFVEEGAASYLTTNEHPIDRLIKALDKLPSAVKLEAPGSLVTGVGSRMASVHEGFRQRLMTHFARIVQEVERMIRKGVADGQIADSVDPDQLAHVVITVSHGIQSASLQGQPEVIWEDARRWLKDFLNSLRK